MEPYAKENFKDSDLGWKCTVYQSRWVKGVSTGGSGEKNRENFWTNPQFLVSLVDVDKNDNENLATMFVALMQKDSRLKRIQTHE